MVANVDLAPTILALAGARREADLALDGKPLMGAARGRERRRTVLVEIHRNRGPSFVGVRTRRFLYARRGRRSRELYDLRRDPYELRNLAGAPRYRDAQARLSRETRRLEDCAGRSCR